MKVLIAGGGLGGLAIAVALSKARSAKAPLEITVIDPKEYYEVRWATLRSFFDERVREEHIVPFSELLPKRNIAIKRAIVTKLHPTTALLSGGEEIEYDVCVLAVGASSPTLGVDHNSEEVEGRKQELKEIGEKLRGKKALVVGGGAVGCEFAGEIAGNANPEQVLLSHQSAELMPQMRPRARKTVASVLEEIGVTVQLETHIERRDDGAWAAKKKGGERHVKVDTHIGVDCTGYRPRNEYMPYRLVDEDGWVRADDMFRVEGFGGRVFALGDCCTLGPNLGTFVLSNYMNVVHNVLATTQWLRAGKALEDLPVTKLKRFRNPPPMMILTLGPKRGVCDSPLGAFQSVLPAIKNKSLFVSKATGTIM